MNEIKEELYQSMLIGDLTINSNTSKEILEYIDKIEQELQRKDNIINELKNGIKELDNMFYETFRISQDGYFSISEWELKDFTDKIKELEKI